MMRIPKYCSYCGRILITLTLKPGQASSFDPFTGTKTKVLRCEKWMVSDTEHSSWIFIADRFDEREGDWVER